uniref:Uncharacterized protein n=1 Tax=Vespula pensylvanica TaxID=30213 RepID=A0A834JNQ1_VESPE|nr:hypothetical protein H0235_017217 [Vespula pensylvanica]
MEVEVDVEVVVVVMKEEEEEEEEEEERANGECSIVSVPQFVAKLVDDNPQGLELLPGFGKSQRAKPAHGLTFRIKQRYVFKLFSSDKSDNARGLTQKMGIEMGG